ncbi:hypothetical protein MCERH10_02587 [Caulobacteraceae bacterium]
MKEVAHSLALWIILASLVMFVSRTEAQSSHSQHANSCREGLNITDISTYVCR